MSNNSQLTSQSTQHFDHMRLLSKLDISNCVKLDDNALKWFPKASLKELVANGLPRLTDDGIKYFCLRHQNARMVTHLSLRDCVNLSTLSVHYICNYCHELVRLDIFSKQTLSLNPGALTKVIAETKKKIYVSPIATTRLSAS